MSRSRRRSPVHALTLALLLTAAPALAQDRVPLAAGQPAPAAGVWLSVPEAQRIVETCTAAEVERDRLRQALAERTPPVPVPALVVGLVLGIAIGVAAVQLVR